MFCPFVTIPLQTPFLFGLIHWKQLQYSAFHLCCWPYPLLFIVQLKSVRRCFGVYICEMVGKAIKNRIGVCFGPLHLFLNEVLHPSWVTNGSLTKNVIIKALILRLLYRTNRRLVSRRLAMYCCYDYDSPFCPKEDLVVLKSSCLLMEIKRVFSVSFSHSLRSASIFHFTVFEAQYNERERKKRHFRLKSGLR